MKGNINKSELSGNQFFDDCPSPMLIYEVETLRILAINKAAIYWYGYSEAEFLKLTIKELWYPDDSENMREVVDKISNEKYYDGGRWRHVRKDGTIFHVHTYSNTTHFNGKHCRMILITDVDKNVKTEGKNRELLEAMNEKAEEVENILESITDAFFATDENWNLIYVNRAAEKMYNVKREDILHKKALEVFPKTPNTKFYDEFYRAVKEQTSVMVEGLSPATGRWILASAYPTKKGIAVYIKDISEQKKLQEHISNNIQNLNSLINNTTDLIWSVDRDFKIISANQAFMDTVYRMNGIRIGPRDYALPKELGAEIIKERQEQYNRALAGETFMAIDERTIEDELVYRETNFNPIIDDKGNVIGVSCFSRNVTERRRQLMKIQEQNEKLKEIAWIQSHKVRGPLATILGLSNIFNDDINDPSNEKIIKGIKEEAQKLDEIIKEVVRKTYDINP